MRRSTQLLCALAIGACAPKPEEEPPRPPLQTQPTSALIVARIVENDTVVMQPAVKVVLGQWNETSANDDQAGVRKLSVLLQPAVLTRGYDLRLVYTVNGEVAAQPVFMIEPGEPLTWRDEQEDVVRVITVQVVPR